MVDASRAQTRRRQARASLAGACTVVALFGVLAGEARAVTWTERMLPSVGVEAPGGVAVDARGDVFVTDEIKDDVVELRPDGTQETLPFTGLMYSNAVAVNAAGDVAVADTFNNRVLVLRAGSTTQQTLPFSGLSHPNGVAVDAAGDVFVADTLNSRVLEDPASGPAFTLPFRGLFEPIGVAVDPEGDVFVDDAHDQVLELTAGNTERLVPFSGLDNFPAGLAADAAGDVFVGDTLMPSRVVEFGAGGQATLPLAGLQDPTGLAVDAAGDVFVADASSGSVDELSPPPPAVRSLLVSPAAGPPGSPLGVTSVTPCPVTGAFGSTRAQLTLYSTDGNVQQTVSAPLDGAGDWSAGVSIPTAASPGTTYFLAARCVNPTGETQQSYADGAFAVTALIPGAAGPAGPAGAAGGAGPAGVNGANGTPGSRGSAGAKGATGPQGAVGASGQSATGWRTTCKTASGVTTCTVTYAYAQAGASATRVEATTSVHGRAEVLGRGTIRWHMLRLTLLRVHPGRYPLTVRALHGHRRSTVIAHTVLDVS